MEHARQRLRLMQLSSSSLPVGSFTWSQGLEWAVEAGWVTDAEAFRRWQIQQMEQSFFCVDLPLFIRLYCACEKQDVATAKRWTAYLLACRETRELALSLGYSWIESAVMAGVKLVPFGQQAAQQLIIDLSDHFAAGFEQAFLRDDDALGAATPLSAIASARHETQYSRLFRS